MQAQPSTTYAIPTLQQLNVGRLALVFPACAGVGYVLGLAVGGSLTSSLYLAALGVPVAIPVFIISGLVIGARYSKHQMEVWKTHNFAWYRETFPQHAHANGHVSCRHCGSHKANVRNLMNRTFMRVHSCSQCGETLYFSPEKI